MKFNPRALALTSGIIWGLTVMLMTWWALAMDLDGRTISKLKNFYLGYDISFVGSIIGLFWGFVDGMICGFAFAYLYNMLSKGKSPE